MPYIIRKTAENPLWRQFQQRVKADGHTLNWVIWELIRRYVAHGLTGPTNTPIGRPGPVPGSVRPERPATIPPAPEPPPDRLEAIRRAQARLATLVQRPTDPK